LLFHVYDAIILAKAFAKGKTFIEIFSSIVA